MQVVKALELRSRQHVSPVKVKCTSRQSSDDGGSAPVFATDGELALLCLACVIYADATFRVVVSLYHQLFPIFIPHADYTFPVSCI